MQIHARHVHLEKKYRKSTGSASFILVCHKKRAIASLAAATPQMGVAKCCGRDKCQHAIVIANNKKQTQPGCA